MHVRGNSFTGSIHGVRLVATRLLDARREIRFLFECLSERESNIASRTVQ